MSTSQNPVPYPADGPPISGATEQDSTPDELSREEMAAVAGQLARSWWLVLLLGVVSAVIGVLVLVWPIQAVAVAGIFFGIWLLVSGVIGIAQMFNGHRSSGTRVLSGISGVIGVILGIVALKNIGMSVEILTLFIGLWWILQGIFQLAAGGTEQGDATRSRGWTIFFGVLGIVAGIVVLVWPIASIATLVLVTGIWLLIIGVVQIIGSFVIRSAGRKAEAALQSPAA